MFIIIVDVQQFIDHCLIPLDPWVSPVSYPFISEQNLIITTISLEQNLSGREEAFGVYYTSPKSFIVSLTLYLCGI